MSLAPAFPPISNTSHPDGSPVIASGQPGPEDFEKLAASGVTVVVNLRPAAEMEAVAFDEKKVAESAGLVYRQIPIATAADLVPANAMALDAAIAEAGAGEGQVLVHCVSANRVGALMALRAALKGQAPEAALAVGRGHGLTRMERMLPGDRGRPGGRARSGQVRLKPAFLARLKPPGPLGRRTRRLAWFVLGLLGLLLALRLWPWQRPLDDVPGASTALFDRHGRLLRLTLAGDDRYRLPLVLNPRPGNAAGAVSPLLTEALRLQEDRAFYFHPGVNPWALLRALPGWARGRPTTGGSTITMQLARLHWRLDTRSVKGKLQQIGLALWLEARQSKREILEAYLNALTDGGQRRRRGARRRWCASVTRRRSSLRSTKPSPWR